MYVPDIDYVGVWTFPITGPDAPDGAPTNVVTACQAVGRDLQCRWHGPDTYIENCLWTISLLDDGHCHLALKPGPRPKHKSAGTSPLRGLGFGGPRIEQSVQELTALIAGEVQDELAGGFVQWPIDGQRMLMPSLRGDKAVWVARSADRVTAEIGTLCQRSAL
ncbi:hypothetical protein C7T36_12640 [Rhodococcus sp. AD45-ID]|uniref:hypothetical protein n=1 Tax=unclassified Rhodococcus (in: high G+C Gram-positive bacteria) TaxID=192944 RepID=UPI0005D43204|nr:MULTISPECIES: hypothetical protein [unclassified Rhodococcus (in: high G+C Gram-positive bacteria)]KJF24680.1 hypothetical protein SZ00_01602 [Rhodococcus sp. AD45]PSR42939.1 hypothetical protein C7T36_12640 [Rhodococcus sp. AD45-ID]